MHGERGIMQGNYLGVVGLTVGAEQPRNEGEGRPAGRTGIITYSLTPLSNFASLIARSCIFTMKPYKTLILIIPASIVSTSQLEISQQLISQQFLAVLVLRLLEVSWAEKDMSSHVEFSMSLRLATQVPVRSVKRREEVSANLHESCVSQNSKLFEFSWDGKSFH
jgi:hypothetical protein